MALVDVLIPTYRRKTGLAMLLATLLGQTFTDFNVVVSDQTPEDESYLESVEIQQAKRALEWHGHEVRLLRHAPPRGLAEQRQFLLEQSEARFVQYLEGARADVEQIYARIARASQHHRLEILEQGRVDKRLFQRWHMGFSTAPQTLVQQLSQSQWRREIPWLEDESTASAGLTRLLAFWKEEAALAR